MLSNKQIPINIKVVDEWLRQNNPVLLDEINAEYELGMSLHYRVMKGEITGGEAVATMKELRKQHPNLIASHAENDKWLAEHRS